jgi:hypothetical protein
MELNELNDCDLEGVVGGLAKGKTPAPAPTTPASPAVDNSAGRRGATRQRASNGGGLQLVSATSSGGGGCPGGVCGKSR